VALRISRRTADDHIVAEDYANHFPDTPATMPLDLAMIDTSLKR
jgi:hypothetical protein